MRVWLGPRCLFRQELHWFQLVVDDEERLRRAASHYAETACINIEWLRLLRVLILELVNARIK